VSSPSSLKFPRCSFPRPYLTFETASGHNFLSKIIRHRGEFLNKLDPKSSLNSLEDPEK